MGVCRGKRAISPWKLGLKGTKISRQLGVRSYIPINWISLAMSLLFPVWHSTLHKSQVHCSGIMQWWVCISLMSTPLPAEVGYRNLWSDGSAVGLYFVTITGQQIFKGSLQVPVEVVLPHRTQPFCWQYSETVTADSGKACSSQRWT